MPRADLEEPVDRLLGLLDVAGRVLAVRTVVQAPQPQDDVACLVGEPLGVGVPSARLRDRAGLVERVGEAHEVAGTHRGRRVVVERHERLDGVLEVGRAVAEVAERPGEAEVAAGEQAPSVVGRRVVVDLPHDPGRLGQAALTLGDVRTHEAPEQGELDVPDGTGGLLELDDLLEHRGEVGSTLVVEDVESPRDLVGVERDRRAGCTSDARHAVSSLH